MAERYECETWETKLVELPVFGEFRFVLGRDPQSTSKIQIDISEHT